MKKLLILSGKGGTGKTTLSSALIKLSKAEAFADCDVDAPNLHLVMETKGYEENKPFYGLPKASIDQNQCISCGQCLEYCRFKAISHKDGRYKVDPIACEGCSLCHAICPKEAIKMQEIPSGELKCYQDDETLFSTAQLKMGSGTSGKLVSEVKKQLYEGVKGHEKWAIIDGSPGIGCPVIASLTGVDVTLIVAEPTCSGISDMKRIIETARRLQVQCGVCINKYDQHLNYTREIKGYCQQEGIPFVGEIPFDPDAIRLINEGLTLVDRPCRAGDAIKEVYKQMMALLKI